MEVNKEEALRCVELSKSKFQQGNTAAALKLAKKSLSLYSTRQGEAWLHVLQNELTATPALPNTTRPRTKTTQKMSSQDAPERDYTQQQSDAVKKLKLKGRTLYEILGVEKAASEGEIKKAYHKVRGNVYGVWFRDDVAFLSPSWPSSSIQIKMLLQVPVRRLKVNFPFFTLERTLMWL